MDSRLQNEATLRKNGSTQREVTKKGRKSIKVDRREHISYKLGRYEIIEKNNGQLFWKSHSGLGVLKLYIRSPGHLLTNGPDSEVNLPIVTIDINFNIK